MQYQAGVAQLAERGTRNAVTVVRLHALAPSLCSSVAEQPLGKRQTRVRFRQLGTPIVFWYSKKLDYLMNPPSPLVPAPEGYEKIECRHAHEVDKWSARLRAQEKRISEMTDEERYIFEDRIRADALVQARKNLATMTDPFNREMAAEIIRRMETSRDKAARPTEIESFQACEAKEGVAS
jgi:hypothetical protein